MLEVAVALSGIFAAVGGVYVAWERKKIDKLTLRVQRLEQEVRARILIEQLACDELAHLGYASTPRAAMLRLREEAEAVHGIRPAMTPRDVE